MTHRKREGLGFGSGRGRGPESASRAPSHNSKYSMIEKEIGNPI